MLNIDLPEHIDNRLELLSLATGRSVRFYVREAILQHLDDIEEGIYAAEARARAHWMNLETAAEADDP